MWRVGGIVLAGGLGRVSPQEGWRSPGVRRWGRAGRGQTRAVPKQGRPEGPGAGGGQEGMEGRRKRRGSKETSREVPLGACRFLRWPPDVAIAPRRPRERWSSTAPLLPSSPSTSGVRRRSAKMTLTGSPALSRSPSNRPPRRRAECGGRHLQTRMPAHLPPRGWDRH